MVKLSYSTFGLTDWDLLKSVEVVDRAGYAGIELAFHRAQFNPFELTDDYLARIKERFAPLSVKPACTATASHFFTPSRPHEPSLMSPDLAGRKRRIDLVRRGGEGGPKMGVSFVPFLRSITPEEHRLKSARNPRPLLLLNIDPPFL